MEKNGKKAWLTARGENKTYGKILGEALEIQKCIKDELNTEEYDYILISDTSDIVFNIRILIAVIPCTGILVCFGEKSKGNFKQMEIAGNKIYYREVAKDAKREKGLLVTKTSGTTGDPKFILYSLENKINRAKQMKKIMNINDDDTMLMTTNLSHSLGLRILFTSIISKCQLEIPDSITIEGIGKAIKGGKTTKLIVVSLVLANILEEVKKKKNNLKRIMLSSSSASADLKIELLQMGIRTFEMYGASEVGTITVKELAENDMNTLGRTLNDTKIEIEKATGQINIRTKNICVGYLNQEFKLYKEFFEGEYFKSGDIGVLDEKGELIYSGRIDNEFKSGGVKINPYSVEQKILKSKIEGMIDCICIGIEDDKLEKVLAINIITVKKLDRLKIKAIRLKLMNILDKHEVPRYLKVTDEVKRLENGKIDRKGTEKDMIRYIQTL